MFQASMGVVGAAQLVRVHAETATMDQNVHALFILYFFFPSPISGYQYRSIN